MDAPGGRPPGAGGSDLAALTDELARLADLYSGWLGDLFDRGFGSPGMDADRRIPWRRGDDARDELTDTFGSPEIYLWGAREQPLYIGMTRSTFGKRFRRYIWADRSQCKLAARYDDKLIDRGIDGFLDDVREWYERGYGSSTVRLEGAVAFAREHGRTTKRHRSV